jgi:Cu+-exporting ATPase
MGTGTDVAMNSAQVTLVKGDLRGIAQARRCRRRHGGQHEAEPGFAFVYNALGVPLAAGLLFPFTGWLLSPMIAALAMSLSSASVIGNALRLRKHATRWTSSRTRSGPLRGRRRSIVAAHCREARWRPRWSWRPCRT